LVSGGAGIAESDVQIPAERIREFQLWHAVLRVTFLYVVNVHERIWGSIRRLDKAEQLCGVPPDRRVASTETDR
jgi:hypothetical protein